MVIPMNFIAGPETILKSTFDAGLAIIRSNAGYGIIDTSGKRMVPPQFEDIGTI